MAKAKSAGDAFAAALAKRVTEAKQQTQKKVAQAAQTAATAVSKQPTKTKEEQRRKDEVMKRFVSALQPSSQTTNTNRGVTSPSYAKAQRQREMNIKGVVSTGMSSPNLSDNLQKSFSLFGTGTGAGIANAPASASDAVEQIRRDNSNFARAVYENTTGKSASLLPNPAVTGVIERNLPKTETKPLTGADRIVKSTLQIGAAGLSAAEDAGGFVSSYGNHAIAAFLRAAGMKDAADTFDRSARSVAENGLFGHKGQKLQQSIYDVYGEDQTKLDKVASALNAGAGYMMPSIAVGTLTAGTSLGASGLGATSWLQTGETGLATMAAQSAQSSAQEAIKEGATTDQAFAYGAAAGTLSALTEKIAGGIPGMPEGTITNAITDRIRGKLMRRAVKASIDLLGEGGEEALETALTPYLKRIFYDKDAKNATAEEIADAALQGVLLAGFMQFGNAAANKLTGGSFFSPMGNAAPQQRSTYSEETLASVAEAVEQAQERSRANGITTDEKGMFDADNDKTLRSVADAVAETQWNNYLAGYQAERESRQGTRNVDTKTDSRTSKKTVQNGSETKVDGSIARAAYNARMEQKQDNSVTDALLPETRLDFLDENDAKFEEMTSLLALTQGKTEAELYQMVKDGDVLMEDVMETLAKLEDMQQQRTHVQEQANRNNQTVQENTETNIQPAQSAAPQMEPIQDAPEVVFQGDALTAEGSRTATGQAGVQGVSSHDRASPTIDSTVPTTEQGAASDALPIDPAETAEQERIDRGLQGKAADISGVMQDAMRVYSTADARLGTSLNTMPEEQFRQFQESLRGYRDRVAAGKSPQATAERYKDIRIDYDAEHPESVDISQLVDINNELYSLREQVKALKTQRKMSVSDIALAEECVKHGSLNYLFSAYNKEMPTDPAAIVDYYELKSALHELRTPVRYFNASRETALIRQAHEHIDGMDRARDKQGFRYSLGTPERNIDHVFRKTHPEQGRRLRETYFDSATSAEARKNRTLEDYRSRIRALDLNNIEAAYVQMVMDDDPRQAERIEQFRQKHIRDIDPFKIEHASEVYRTLFAEIHDQVNASLVRNGYDTIGKLNKYTPHFEEELGKMRGWLRRHGLYRTNVVRFSASSQDNRSFADIENFDPAHDGELPNAIAGKTEEFRGRHRWSGNTQTRTGVHTDYNINVAFENYIEPMLDIIYMTDSVSRLRTLEDQIRYETSSIDVQNQFDEIMSDTNIGVVEKRQQLEDLWNVSQGFGETVANAQNVSGKRVPPNNLSGFITWLRRYTDNLAGKKSVDDRAMEYYLGRSSYKHVNSIFSRISMNMTTSFSSTLTNVIPVVGSLGEAGPQHVAMAFLDTARNAVRSDGFTDMSDFLVNRRGGGMRTTAGFFEQATGSLQVVDEISAQVVTRAFYRQALDDGLSHTEALERANQRAGQLMADRSKTQLPLLFQSSNPVLKLATQFQVEVNNDVQHHLKDLPKRIGEDGFARVAGGLTVSMIAYHAFNDLFEKAFGYRPYGLDFAEWIAQLFDLDKDDDEEKDTVYENLMELGGNIADALPVVSNLTGGGRVPMTAALPGGSLQEAAKSAAVVLSPDSTAEERKQELLNEWTKPFVTLAFPGFGNQIRKSGLGIYTVANGGEYGTDKDGKKALKYAVDSNDPVTRLKAIISGKSAFEEAKDYYGWL